MAGELNLVSSTTVTSSVASVELTGIDATYDIYKLVITNARSVNVAGAGWRLRWLVSGSPETGTDHYTQLMYHYGASDFTWSGVATDYRYSGNNLMYIGVGGAGCNQCDISHCVGGRIKVIQGSKAAIKLCLSGRVIRIKRIGDFALHFSIPCAIPGYSG
jgi:hypothetical protein